ncbi:MAG: ribonuclease HII [Candidatus Kerfeldbacteria bacterium CG15_BIG_FIL_POST_REV_8_21_14_020_45_12]|uniref:Ribonuclease HII n=1 Tax=Candidatus Kerfeldbacteria bacterium CG15_BIG_FIL_POST_REV_8_21_14_020_45_12 TaxID=2014247 RepID=A0A2M7H2P7_9BACT|nr:MAG: ribonuclease HII [Candidatus Kerfeldbacteria bacterium CG15_BIG_FIL_POST_REV_8_21_14_020_45_12]PJA93249.1 MAG: ribonuclease HII [Candidatus Kerfeldbacteria bacterium CG_4_9_14_3_um_filter_45_8]
MSAAKTAPLTLELELIAAGYRLIVGVDEVGRGAWAGPIMAAAVIMPVDKVIVGVRDSKKITPKRRAVLASEIEQAALSIGLGSVDSTEIDEIGIGPANALVIRRAVEALSLTPDYILVDAFPMKDLSAPSRSIIRGDSASYSIAAASIYAKVARDSLMQSYDEKFPGYSFSAHVGYGTEAHRAALDQFGPCPIHRLSFQPMAAMI